MTSLTIELPDTIFATLRRSPREVSGEVRLAAAVDWYRRGVVSQGRAAEIAGMSRADFIDELAARQVEVVQVDFAGLDEELRLVSVIPSQGDIHPLAPRELHAFPKNHRHPNPRRAPRRAPRRPREP